MSTSNWETVVPWTSDIDIMNPPARRMKVPGGWLYQVSEVGFGAGGGARVVSWLIPVFVADGSSASDPR